LRVVFLGTPEFSVASLRAIVDAGFDVVAAVTAPDRPAGRGMHLQESAVKQAAKSLGIPVLQPLKLKDPQFLEELASYKADLQVVIAFRMLPEAVWNMPPLGTVNLHASLLPDYRGAAPINWALINNEKESGVSTFFLKHEIDTGDLIMRRNVPLTDDMNAGELHDLLMKVGAEIIVKTLEAIRDRTYTLTPQQGGSSKMAPKIFTGHCRINWEENGEKIHHLIRGLSPYPGAFTTLDEKNLKIYESVFIPASYMHNAPGEMISDGRTYMRFACKDGWIDVKTVQLEGKRKMPVEELLKGYRQHK
jgi:methionyl-tRNA formyltransferase